MKKWKTPVMTPRYVYENCKVVRVIDGDTIVFNIDLGFDIIKKVTVRLHGIDVYEKTLRNDQTQKEKELGLKAVGFVEKILTGRVIRVHTLLKGKYGRYISNVYILDKGSWKLLQACLLNANLVKTK